MQLFTELKLIAFFSIGLSAITLFACLIFGPIIHAEITAVWGEIDVNIRDFKEESDVLWMEMQKVNDGARFRRQASGATGVPAGAVIGQAGWICPSGKNWICPSGGHFIGGNSVGLSQTTNATGSELVTSAGVVSAESSTAGTTATPAPVVPQTNGLICTCQNNNNCPPGPQGPKGASGQNGQPGLRGSTGKPGAVGENTAGQLGGFSECIKCPAGPPGPPGPPGEDGITGSGGRAGPAGTPGMPGEPGERGEVGPPGTPGTSKKGPKGSPGVDATGGRKGPAGPKGAPGIPGQPGPQGITGISATEGPPGPRGIPGAPGDPGFPGIQGFSGQPGPPAAAGLDAQYCACPQRSGASFAGSFRDRVTNKIWGLNAVLKGEDNKPNELKLPGPAGDQRTEKPNGTLVDLFEPKPGATGMNEEFFGTTNGGKPPPGIEQNEAKSGPQPVSTTNGTTNTVPSTPNSNPTTVSPASGSSIMSHASDTNTTAGPTITTTSAHPTMTENATSTTAHMMMNSTSTNAKRMR